MMHGTWGNELPVTEPDELASGHDLDPFEISGEHPPPPTERDPQPYPHPMPGRTIDD